jgi:2-polyprenyl-3-methyl-5-hydroxy-6-metoxy-1,4-benzoquinol methylase
MSNWANWTMANKVVDPENSHSLISVQDYVWALFVRNCLLDINLTNVDTHIRGKRVLDLGCGSLFYTSLFLMHGAESVYAIDRQDVINELRTSGMPLNDGKVSIKATDIMDMPFASSRFDTVWISEVAHGKENPFVWLSDIVDFIENNTEISVTILVNDVELQSPNPHPAMSMFAHLDTQLGMYCGGRLMTETEMEILGFSDIGCISDVHRVWCRTEEPTIDELD